MTVFRAAEGNPSVGARERSFASLRSPASQAEFQGDSPRIKWASTNRVMAVWPRQKKIGRWHCRYEENYESSGDP